MTRANSFLAVATALFVLLPLVGQDTRETAGLWKQIGKTTNAESVAAAERLVDAFVKEHPKAAEGPALVQQIGHAWLRVGAHEDALRVFERLGVDWADHWAAHAALGKARVYLHAGDEDNAISLLEIAAAAPAIDTHQSIMDASNTRNFAFGLLAACYERRKDWKRALEALEKWRPSSWCGTCRVGIAWSRDVRIATCRFELGEVAAALGKLEAIVSNDGGMWNDAGTDASMFYAEYAARGGQLERARKFVAATPKARDRLAVPMKIAEAWSDRSANGIVDALRNLPIHSMGSEADYRAAARLLTDLGPDGEKVLNDGVVAEDPTVVAIRQALDRVRSESRPVSRPSK